MAGILSSERKYNFLFNYFDKCKRNVFFVILFNYVEKSPIKNPRGLMSNFFGKGELIFCLKLIFKFVENLESC